MIVLYRALGVVAPLFVVALVWGTIGSLAAYAR